MRSITATIMIPPQIATGLTFNLPEQRSISAKIMRNWKDGQPSSTGVSLGFKQGFDQYRVDCAPIGGDR
jgi:hypothetical protein